MFSGIIEEAAPVVNLEKEKGNLHITMSCSFADQLSIDQSVSHNGVCLTVVKINPEEKQFTVTAVKETLDKSNLGNLHIGDRVNLERSVKSDSFLDGHIVQGHVDQTAQCTEVREAEGSWYFRFAYQPAQEDYITIEKGSISINGVSMTVVNAKENSFEVAVIPYTYENTNFHQMQAGTIVNLEFDVIGKYVAKIVKQQLDKA
jgi:riboflavin synthase